METFNALLALSEEISPVSDEFPSQRPVTQGFDVFLDLRLNKRLSKQSWNWLFETPSRSLWRHCNVSAMLKQPIIFDLKHHHCQSSDHRQAPTTKCWYAFVSSTSTSNPRTIALHWRHDDHDGVSNHQPHGSLLNRYSGADQRKHQSSASLAFVGGIHRDRLITRTKSQ